MKKTFSLLTVLILSLLVYGACAEVINLPEKIICPLRLSQMEELYPEMTDAYPDDYYRLFEFPLDGGGSLNLTYVKKDGSLSGMGAFFSPKNETYKGLRVISYDFSYMPSWGEWLDYYSVSMYSDDYQATVNFTLEGELYSYGIQGMNGADSFVWNKYENNTVGYGFESTAAEPPVDLSDYPGPSVHFEGVKDLSKGTINPDAGDSSSEPVPEQIAGRWLYREGDTFTDMILYDNFLCFYGYNSDDPQTYKVYYWVLLGNSINILDPSSSTVGVVDTLNWTGTGFESVYTGHLLKQDDFTITKPVAKTAESVEEFYGEWEIVAIGLDGAENGYFVVPAQAHPGLKGILYIDGDMGHFRFSTERQDGSNPQMTILPLFNLRMENGQLFMDIGFPVEGSDQVYVAINLYENGWVSSPWCIKGYDTFYMARKESSEAGSSDGETAQEHQQEDGETASKEMSTVAVAAKTEPESKVMHTNRAGLEVKESASNRAKTLVTLRKDREVTVIGTEGEWIQIEVDLGNKKVSGYVPDGTLK